MLKLGKEIVLGEYVNHVGEYVTTRCRVVLNNKNKGYFTSNGFVKIKQRTEYKVVA